MHDPASNSQQLVDALHERFDARWRLDLDEATLTMRPRTPTQAGPRRRTPAPIEIVRVMQQVFEAHDVPRSSLLPIRWGRDTDLLISAIQGLDPWLKDGADRTWREGFLPQPVVRFTGDRDAAGRLRDGFLTSFVNLSCVRRITGVDHHTQLLDVWLDALSAVGIHAGRLRLTGDTGVWQRGPVSGITLTMTCDEVTFADAVLLWHTAAPHRMATDLGTGLERLRWLLSAQPWPDLTFGPAVDYFDSDLLDAVRTATLLAMAGIRAGDRDAGDATRRVLARIPPAHAAAGLGRLVREQRGYWADLGMTGPPWPQLSEAIEHDVLTRNARRSR